MPVSSDSTGLKFGRSSPNKQSEDRIRRLEDDLHEARKTILDLAPDRFRSLLYGYESGPIESSADIGRWEHSLHTAVIEAAEPIPPTGIWGGPQGDRAACPLCRSRSDKGMGSKLPNGLSMHLESSYLRGEIKQEGLIT